MQAYLKYKAYYDRKAKACPLSTNDYCFILNPKSDTQSHKVPFKDFRWEGPFKVEKVLPNNNYIVRRVNTKFTQILHRIRLRRWVPKNPIQDIRVKENEWVEDTGIAVAQDDLYAISWETNFGDTPLNQDPKVPNNKGGTLFIYPPNPPTDLANNRTSQSDNSTSNPSKSPKMGRVPEDNTTSEHNVTSDVNNENEMNVQNDAHEDTSSPSSSNPPEIVHDAVNVQQDAINVNDAQNSNHSTRRFNSRYDLRPNPPSKFSDSYIY